MLAKRPAMERNADRDTMNDTEAWLPDLTGPLRWSWVQAMGPEILGMIADQLYPSEAQAAAASLPAPATVAIDRRVVWRA